MKKQFISISSLPIETDGKRLIIENNKVLLDKIMDDFPVRPDIVMIQGEMTFTYAMIQLLLVKGITSVAACSDRVSNEVVQADGTTKKVSEFKFVQFREY